MNTGKYMSASSISRGEETIFQILIDLNQAITA